MSDESLTLCPYNPNNHLVTEEDLVGIFRKCGLDLNPVSVKSYHEAFIHRSYVRKKVLAYSKRGQGKVTLAPRPPNCLELQPESNERLEFLGDSVIDCVVVSYLFRRFPEADEGFMTKLKNPTCQDHGSCRFCSIPRPWTLSHHLPPCGREM